MTVYAQPGTEGSKVTFKARYDNCIGGEWVAPVKGQYFENPTPVTGKAFCEVARGTAEDIELALDAAHEAAPAWGKTSVAERAAILNKIADRIEENLETLAVAETWDNGKPIRETLDADIPLAVDHFRYFAGAIRAQEGSLSQIDDDTVAYHFHEPLGVVGQIIPWNFPILMAVWKLAPALAAGNAVVLKPAEQTPASILYLMELIGDLLPAGVLNVVNGFGVEAGKPLASSNRDPQDRVHRRDHHRPADHAVRQPEPDPGHPGAGRQEPQHLLRRRRRPANDAFYDKALEGFTHVRPQPGRGLHLPVARADPGRHLRRASSPTPWPASSKIIQGNPLDTDTMIGAQASNDQLEKILSYIDIGKQEGAKVLTGGERADLGGDLSGGYYVQPTIFEGNNTMRIFQEEIFGPVVSVTRFTDYDDAIKIANDTLYGLGAGVWSPRRQHRLPRRSRHPGRPGVDELLPRLPGARGVRRLQAVRHRPREPQDDARPLPADQEPAGQLHENKLGFF